MNAAAQLTEGQLASIQELLRQRALELAEKINPDLAAIAARSPIDRGGHDAGDESFRELVTLLGVDKAQRESGELDLILESLDSIASGGYGQCADCAEAIEPERLLANPISRRCVDCQEKHEDLQQQKDQTPSL